MRSVCKGRNPQRSELPELETSWVDFGRPDQRPAGLGGRDELTELLLDVQEAVDLHRLRELSSPRR